MKIQSKFKIIILFVILFLIFFTSKVFAASISVGPSKSSVSPGESFSVSINASGATGKVSISVSNGSVSKSSLWLEPSGSVTVTAGSSGTVSISVSAVDMSDDAGNEVSPYGSATVNIVVPTPPPSNSGGNSGGGSSNSGGSSSSRNSGSSSSGNSGSTTPKPNNNTKPNTGTNTKPVEVKKSTDAKLKSLTIEGFELYPEFDANVNEYNVKVSNDITAVNITSEVNDSKATATLEGVFENLEVGENIANVLVTAEDGSTNRYVIKINRERENLKLQTLKISYIDETGNVIEITPELQEDVFNYTLEDIPYYVNKLELEVLSNLEEAKIEIIGDKDFYEGENEITVTITMPSESEEVEDEVLKYAFNFNKEKAPKITLIGKIGKWFKGITGTIGTWFNNNKYQIVMGALMLCSATLGGLSVYLAFAYKKYKLLVKKVAEITKMNAETPSVIQTETVLEGLNKNMEVNQEQVENEIEETQTPKSKGRHF